MMDLPGLNLIERLALWILVRSPRTSLVVVKETLWPMVFVAADKTDPMLAEPEPLSMQFERIYHQPSAGEVE
ncbi:MAG: hypothetical protein RLZZ515_1316 [Cyanobacteriota bacterium]|jgi:hypothetical protein